MAVIITLFCVYTCILLFVTAVASRAVAVQGCYRDNAGSRDLPVEIPGFTWTLTPPACVTACSNAGYSYAGLQVMATALPVSDISLSCRQLRLLLRVYVAYYIWIFYVIPFLSYLICLPSSTEWKLNRPSHLDISLSYLFVTLSSHTSTKFDVCVSFHLECIVNFLSAFAAFDLDLDLEFFLPCDCERIRTVFAIDICPSVCPYVTQTRGLWQNETIVCRYFNIIRHSDVSTRWFIITGQ